MAITELDVGGAEKAFVRIAIGLKDRGWHVNVISLRDAGPLAETLNTAGIEVTALNAGGFLDARAIWRMAKVLRTQQPDVLLSFLHQANIVGRIAARWAKVPTVLSGVRVADRRWSVWIPERLTRWLVDRYVAVSHAVGQVHCQFCGIRSDRMSVVPNGVDLEAIRQTVAVDRQTIGCTTTDTIVLCVGRLSAQKAPEDVLEAFGLLNQSPLKSSSRLRLIFVGEGPMRQLLEHRVRDGELSDQVQILGWRPDVFGLMKASDVLVLASHWEGLPNVILEAQAVGLPVVASDVDGCRELIQDGVTGRLFRCGEPQHLTETLQEVLGNPPRTRQLAEAASRHLESHYCWEHCIAGFQLALVSAAQPNH